MTRCKSYHHGDLRNALIMAAVELIEESGAAEFTMADAARRAGVSAAAPYRHFSDRNELLEAVSELYFIGLGEAAEATREAWPEGSREAIIALGQMYARYVLSRGGFYNLAWSWEQHPRASQDGEADRPGFNTFVGAVEAWCAHRGLLRADPLDLAIKLWGLAHGLAVLKMNGQLAQTMPGAQVEEMLTSGANAFLDGVEQER